MEIQIDSDDESESHEEYMDDNSSFCDSASDEDNAEEIAPSSSNPLPFWSNLPSPAIEKIYLCLNRKDQCRVSSVCKTWLQEYCSPTIWRNVVFVLPEQEYSSGVCPEVRWAQKHGEMFASVEIRCKRVRLRLQQVIWQQLRLFLQALICHSQLSTLSFVNMARYLRILDEIVFEDVFQSITNLLLAQNKLTSIEFRNTELRQNKALEILKIICVKHGGILKNLNLEGFVKESPDDMIADITSTQIYYETLMNLRELITDYSQIFENIVTACFSYGISDAQGRKGILQKMKIACNGSLRVSYQGIPSMVWKYFRKTFPALRIDLSFSSGSIMRNRFEIFVVPHMPIRSLIFKWNKSNNRTEQVQNEIGSLFQYIAWCESTDLLEELTIMWPHNSTNLASDLVIFLRSCSRLRILQLYIQHPVVSLDSVLKWWLENGVIALEVAHITVANVQTADDAEQYTNLVDEYYSLLQVLGLNLILIVDSVLRSSR